MAAPHVAGAAALLRQRHPEEVDYDLVPAPGAVVIFEPGGTTVTGVG